MKILITGGAGFQGSHLTEEFIKAGHDVSILNTPTPEASENVREIRGINKIIWGSITDKEIVEKAVRDREIVYHLGAHINVDESIQDPEQTFFVNVMGTLNVLEASRRNGCQVVYASSCEVYGKPTNEGPMDEFTELRPHSPYAASKAAADRMCFAYYKTYNLPVTITRCFNIFGERQKEGKFGAVIPIFVSQALKGEPITLFGSGEQTRDYVYISDTVKAYVSVFNRRDLSGEVLNFATGKGTSIKDIAQYIARKFSVDVKTMPARAGEVSNMVGDYSKAKKLLGWEPRVSIWDGINNYIDWRKNINSKL